MSRSTEIVISSARCPADPPEAVRCLLSIAGADAVFIATRTTGLSRSFEQFMAYVQGEADDPYEPSVDVGSRVPAEEVPALYRDGTCLTMDLSACPLVESLGASIQENLSADDLDEFFLTRAYLRVGEHDIFEVDREDQVNLLGRYFASLTLLADGTPSSPDDVRDGVLALPEFRDLLARFEHNFGRADIAFVYQF